MNLEIRDARRVEVPAALKLIAEDSLVSSGEPGPLSEDHFHAFDLIARHPDHRLIVGILDGELIATLQLGFIPSLGFRGVWRGQVEGVRVRSDRRGRGIGAAMMNWAVERCRERGCTLVQLTSNRARTEARRFYERLGFEASHIGMKLYL